MKSGRGFYSGVGRSQLGLLDGMGGKPDSVLDVEDWAGVEHGIGT